MTKRVPTQANRNYTIRRATLADQAAIAEIKKQTWPEEPVQYKWIGQALSAQTHTALVAQHAKGLAGFVDNFVTSGPRGPRWEVDLLAVAPAFRGQRLGEALVSASIQAARDLGVGFCRALIQKDNVASQVSFSRAGFVSRGDIHKLYLSLTPGKGPMPALRAGILPVQTMNYCGLWVEPPFQRSSLLAAQRLMQRGNSDLAGAVIPACDAEACQRAEALGYACTGEYCWWEIDC